MSAALRKRFSGVLALLLAAGNAAAGGENGLPGEFLNVGVGGKPMAMGRAYTAVSDDINAIYWNPAGVSTYRSSQIMLQSSPLELGGAYHYLAYSQPMYSLGSFGVAIANVSSGEVDRVDSNNVVIGSYQARETAYLGAYSYRFSDLLSVGGTLKGVENVVDGRKAKGYGMDAGVMYQIREDKYKVGAVLRNLWAPEYGFGAEKETFPRILRLGGAAYFFEDRLLTSVDVDKTIGASQGPRWHLGAQTYFLQNLFFRAGLDQTEVTGGLGFRWNTLEVDYAAGFQTQYQDFGLSNRISVKVLFGGYEIDVRAAPRVFSPVGLKNKTAFKIRAANRRRIINWIISVRNAKNEVVRSFQGHNAPPKVVEWDGRNAAGELVEPGEYIYRLAATDAKGRSETTPARTLRILAPTPFEIEAR
jgi:hypothetical protein